MSYDAVLFDLDGTLTESAEGILRTVRWTLEKRGHSVPDEATLRAFVGPPLTYSYRTFCGIDSDMEIDRLIDDYHDRYSREGWCENRVYPGIAPLLRELRRRGTYLAVASAKPLPFVRRILEHFGLDMWMDRICAFNMGEETVSKTEILKSALPGGVSPARCAMVGDRMYDITAAREIGIRAIGAAYGYGSRAELEESGADEIAEDVPALCRILLDGDMPRGDFITFEGGDGCGKSTQMEKTAEYLTRRGYDVLVTREPGGTGVGEEIRRILLSPDTGEITPECEAFLFCASRAEHVRRVIRPGVECGKSVLSDRFLDSSIAYQGYGRELDGAIVRQMNERAVDGLLPDLTFLFSLDADTARSRIGSPDRIEGEPREFADRVNRGYRELAAAEPDRIRVIDAGRGIGEIFVDVCRELSSRKM